MNLAKIDTSKNTHVNNNVLMKYLTFRLGSEFYAVNIVTVREIFEYGEITAMPMMPEFICGAINLRGRAVPVIDLAKRMQQGAAEFSNRACIVIVEMHYNDTKMDVGVIVDAVSRVIDLSDSEIDNTPTFGGNIRTDFITGLGKVEDKFVIILNMEKVLSMDDLRAISEVAPNAETNQEQAKLETKSVDETNNEKVSLK